MKQRFCMTFRFNLKTQITIIYSKLNNCCLRQDAQLIRMHRASTLRKTLNRFRTSSLPHDHPFKKVQGGYSLVYYHLSLSLRLLLAFLEPLWLHALSLLANYSLLLFSLASLLLTKTLDYALLLSITILLSYIIGLFNPQQQTTSTLQKFFFSKLHQAFSCLSQSQEQLQSSCKQLIPCSKKEIEPTLQ
ncbi:hypothetical protein FGO68_gene11035 [Halteria grandinella]|uniref:Uncharacterized protein n=1 Tax=Halteria grandinella TaxID=5974 RepID=A0A8J8NSQ2_HALGN|nr:hypothetical protein FGO68_gene11035 [Halteria grandinella]